MKVGQPRWLSAMATLLSLSQVTTALVLQQLAPPSEWPLTVMRWQEHMAAANAFLSSVHVAYDQEDLGIEFGQDWGNANLSTMTTMRQMVDCWNSKFHPSTGTTWDATLSDAVDQMNLKIVGAWWSSTGSQSFNVTVATSGSITRLPQLEAHCKSWPGPTSAVLWLPLRGNGTTALTEEHQARLRLAVLQVTQFVASMQLTPGSCQPNILLVYEVFADWRAMKLMFPVNILRSLAQLQVQSPLVAGVDVDLLMSRAWTDRFRDLYVTADMVEQAMNKTVFVIPTFDITPRVGKRDAWADALSSARKKDIVVAAYQLRYALQFKKKSFPRGHRLVNYVRWTTATEDYEVRPQFESEPFLVGARMLMPWYDARYRGYGKNKVQYVADVASRGFTFKVMHDAYMIHRWHRKTDAWKLYVADKQENKTDGTNLFTHAKNLFVDQVRQIKAGLPFNAVLHPATQHCIDVLPWWSGSAAASNSIENTNSSSSSSSSANINTYTNSSSSSSSSAA